MTEPPSGQLTHTFEVDGDQVLIHTTGTDHDGAEMSWRVTPTEMDRACRMQCSVAAIGRAAQDVLDGAARGEMSREAADVIVALLLGPYRTTRVQPYQRRA